MIIILFLHCRHEPEDEVRERGAWRSSPRDVRGSRDIEERGPRDRIEGDSWRRREDGAKEDRNTRDFRGPRDERYLREERGVREERFRDDRGPRDRLEDRGGASSWRRGGDREEDRSFREDRETGNDWRRGSGTREERGAREERDDWRRGGGGRDERGPAPRDKDDRPSWRERSAAASRDVRLDEPGGPSWRRGERPKEERSGEDTWRHPREDRSAQRDERRDREDHGYDNRPSWKERQAANSRDVRLDEGMEKTWRKREEERKAAQKVQGMSINI